MFPCVFLSRLSFLHDSLRSSSFLSSFFAGRSLRRWAHSRRIRMREGNKLVGLSSRGAWRRQKKARLRQRLPEHRILKGDRSTTAFSLRHHSVYVAHANPILVKRDSPLGMIMSLRPRPMHTQRAEIDVFDVERFVNAVRVGDRRNFPPDPRLVVHIFAKRWPNELVP